LFRVRVRVRARVRVSLRLILTLSLTLAKNSDYTTLLLISRLYCNIYRVQILSMHTHTHTHTHTQTHTRQTASYNLLTLVGSITGQFESYFNRSLVGCPDALLIKADNVVE